MGGDGLSVPRFAALCILPGVMPSLLERGTDDQAVDAIRSEGFVVLPELLSRDQVDEIKHQLAPWLQGRLMGRNDFEGFCSERVYALLSKAPAIAQIVEHPRVLAIVDRLLRPHFRLSACLAVQVHPGETPQADPVATGDAKAGSAKELLIFVRKAVFVPASPQYH